LALLSASGAQTETIPLSIVLITIGSVTGVSTSATSPGRGHSADAFSRGAAHYGLANRPTGVNTSAIRPACSKLTRRIGVP